MRAALLDGVPVQALCLYPILDYPGWDNDRVCAVGLFSMPDQTGERTVCSPFAEELRRQQGILETVVSPEHARAGLPDRG